MLATGGGAWYLPPQAAIRRSRRGSVFMEVSLGGDSEPRPRDHRDREARQRVLEDVFVGAFVEQVLGLDVDPEGAGCADAHARVQEQLRPDERGLERVARDLGVE